MLTTSGNQRHYLSRDLRAACGAACTGGYMFMLEYVTCPFCKETEVFKQEIIKLEVGFDGDVSKYAKAFK